MTIVDTPVDQVTVEPALATRPQVEHTIQEIWEICEDRELLADIGVDLDDESLVITDIDTSSIRGSAINNHDGTITYDPNGQFEFLADGVISELFWV